MRSRVLLDATCRTASAVLAAALVIAVSWSHGALVAADEDPGVVDARAEVDRLRSELEIAYLDVQRDHARVRLPEWTQTPLGDAFTAVLKEFVKDARPPSASRSADEDAAAAEVLIRGLADRHAEPPLTITSLRVVLPKTARSARADEKSPERDLFVAAARTTFEQARPEDAWDAQFLTLPVVVAYRAAHAQLAATSRALDPSAPGSAPATPDPKSSPGPAKPVDDMVLCDRARVWLGPWSGWTTDIPEKQNKRQQRTVKVLWIDRFEVTCAQYRDFLMTLGPSSRRAMLPQGWTLAEGDVVQIPEGRERHPVTGVSLAQATAYAESLGKRIPTADEWERAAGGGDKEPRAFPWGGTADEKIWGHSGAEMKGTCPVDAYLDDVTPERVVGMAGNVAELVSTYSDRTDIGKSGPEKDRQTFVCGGSFKSRASECGPGWRWVIDPGGALANVGFRCVMDDAEYRKRRK